MSDEIELNDIMKELKEVILKLSEYIPYSFSLALCIAMEQQKPPLSLSYFIDPTLSELASGSGKSRSKEGTIEP